jgi:hypothetical protein
MQQFKVLQPFEVVGANYEFSYKAGQVINAGMLDWERYVRQGYLEVFGPEAAAKKSAATENVANEPKRKRGRPPKVTI